MFLPYFQVKQTGSFQVPSGRPAKNKFKLIKTRHTKINSYLSNKKKNKTYTINIVNDNIVLGLETVHILDMSKSQMIIRLLKVIFYLYKKFVPPTIQVFERTRRRDIEN